MYIWQLSQTTNRGYDTYDAAIVIAETEEEARKIYPSDYCDKGEWWIVLEGQYQSEAWAETLEQVTVVKVGTAEPEATAGLLLASFNAG